jgi:hypothetical protein
MIVRKLDKRHSGYGYFSHYISPPATDAMPYGTFENWKAEIYDIWGDPGRVYKQISRTTGRWQHTMEYNNKTRALDLRIYVRNERDLT